MSIITISREMASGALAIAQMAAEELDYTLIDGQLVRDIAPQYGLTAEDIDQADEKPPAFVDSLDRKLMLTLNQIEMIVLDQARNGNVIIHGRAGRDVLLNMSQIFNVRIIAPFEDRVERLAEAEWIDPELAWKMVRKSDQQRAGFMRFYFDRDWADPLSYDLVINTRYLSEETAARLIVDGVKSPAFSDDRSSLSQLMNELLLRKKIQIAYLQDEQAEGLPFEVAVHGNRVTLSGSINDEEQRKGALAAVSKVDSSLTVDDEMKLTEHRSSLSIE